MVNCWKNIIMTLIAVAMSSVSMVSLQRIDYSTLQAMGLNCRSKHSCSEITTATTFDNKLCECDPMCRNFQDCCIDAPARQRSNPISGLTCLPGVKENKGAYVLSRCQTGWTGEVVIRRNCEGNLNNFSDPFLSAPLTDTRRSVTYKNRYCAECNNVVPSDLVTWPIFIACEDTVSSSFNSSGDITMRYIEDNLVYSESTNSWGVNYGSGSQSTFFPCRVVFDTTEHLQHYVRFCRPNLTSTCAISWRRPNIQRLCNSYTAVVYTDEATYKNPHCALCNNVNLSDMKCSYGVHERTRPPMSFTLFADVNTRGGNRVGQVNNCPGGQKWDPFFKKCRTLECVLPGFSMVNGRCVRQ